MRRRLLAGVALSLPVLLACTSGPPVTADTQPTSTSGVEAKGLAGVRISWARVESGFASPTQVTSAPDGTNRLFVVEQSGRVKVVRSGKELRKAYINLSRKVSSGGERGLLSVAFSPRFRNDKKLFVAYTKRQGGDVVVASMRASRPAAPQIRNKTLKPLLRVEHSRFSNHNGGQLAFGPDGNLYIGTGDGGGSNDELNTAQRRTDLRGKILRINPHRTCGGKRYCIPKSNPFVGKKGRPEIYLLGLRNPWRFSFDFRTDSLWIGDVGQGEQEEINRVPQNPNRINLGWSCREGNQVFIASRCRAGVNYLNPATVVNHPAGESITGGFVYRGERYRKLIGGAYVFGDFVTRRVWLYKPGRGKHAQAQRLGPSQYSGPTSFGVSSRDEIYAVTYDGSLWRMRVNR